MGQDKQRRCQRDQVDRQAVICAELDSSVRREGDFGHSREVVEVVGKTEKEIGKGYENIVDEVGERENEGRPGCQKSVAEEFAKLMEDLEI